MLVGLRLLPILLGFSVLHRRRFVASWQLLSPRLSLATHALCLTLFVAGQTASGLTGAASSPPNHGLVTGLPWTAPPAPL